MSQHTPGPWGCIDTSNYAHDYRLTKPNGAPLPLSVEAYDHSEQRANARLIATAPDLLAALTTLYRIGCTRLADNGGHGEEWTAIAAAREAIAKAGGTI